MSSLQLASLASVGFCGSDLAVPRLDFDKLGDLVLGGDFDSLTALTYAGQESVLSLPSGAEDKLIYQSNNEDQFIQRPFANGVISHSCEADDMLIVAGNFTNVFNTSIKSGIAGVFIDNQTAIDLTETLNSTNTLQGSDIHSVYCNNSMVYLGGRFDLGESAGVIVYDSESHVWSSPDFGGFLKDSSIETIIPHNDNLVFGGQFSGSAPLSAIESWNMSNQTTNSFNNYSRLQPGMQPISFNLANATGYGSKSASATNASAISCPLSSDGWVADSDSTTGFINVTSAYSSEPTWIRSYNLADGSGTRTFRIISEPAGSFMNLTYTDEKGDTQSCSAYCPLPEYDSSVRSTDFQFVNVVPTTSSQIQLLDFYGDHAGLDGIQMFESGQFVFANDKYNQQRPCGSQSSKDYPPTSHINLRGNGWTLMDDFLSTQLTGKSSSGDVFADFEPALSAYQMDSGRYEIQSYTPGCRAYKTCSERGKVNVTVYPGSGTPQSTIIYQTNEESKYDIIYNGTLKQGAHVQSTPVRDNNVPFEFVAYKISSHFFGSRTHNATTLFEYSPSYFLHTGDPVASSAINSLGLKLGNGEVSVSTLLLNGNDTLLVGGKNFPSNMSQSNLISSSLDDVNATGVQSIDLATSSEEVTQLANSNDTVFVSTDKQSYLLAHGKVNDTQIGPISEVTSVFLNSSQYWALTPANADAKQVRIYDPKSEQLLSPQSLTPAFIGRLTNMVPSKNQDQTIYVGNVMVVDSVTPDSATITESGQQTAGAFPYSIDGSDALSLLTKRGSNGQSDNRINSGVYLDSSRLISAGHFMAKDSQNTSIPNAIQIYSNNTVSNSSGLAGIDSLPSESTEISATETSSDISALGGQFSGKVANNNVQSSVLYELRQNGWPQLAGKQPSSLSSNGNVRINASTFKPGTAELIVGGDFSADDNVSNGTCNGLCIYDTDQHSWKSLRGMDSQSQSVVNSLVFETSERLVLSGDIRTSKGSGQVATYDFRNNSSNVLPSLSGAMSQIVVLSNSSTTPQYAGSGNATFASDFVRFFDGSSWKSIPDNPSKNDSVVNTISLVSSESSQLTNNSTPFSPSKALSVSGDSRTDAVNASVFVYDGMNWTPLYAAQNFAASSGTTASVSTVFAQRGGKLDGGVSYNSVPSSTSGGSGSGSNKQNDEMPAGQVVGIACAIGICCVLLSTSIYSTFEWALNRSSSSTSYQNLAQYKPGDDLMAGSKVVK